jgi:hypothetical protein
MKPGLAADATSWIATQHAGFIPFNSRLHLPCMCRDALWDKKTGRWRSLLGPKHNTHASIS